MVSTRYIKIERLCDGSKILIEEMCETNPTEIEYIFLIVFKFLNTFELVFILSKVIFESIK